MMTNGMPRPRPRRTPREVPPELLLVEAPGEMGTTVGTTVWMPVRPWSIVENVDEDGVVVVVMAEDSEFVDEVEVVVEGVLVGIGIVMVRVESTRSDENPSDVFVVSSKSSVLVTKARSLSSPGFIGAESSSPAVKTPPSFEQSHAPERASVSQQSLCRSSS